MHIKAGVARALRWGAGGFALGNGAALTLEGLEIGGEIIVAAGADLELKQVTFAPGSCVRGQATLVDTPSPELCLRNVIFDGDDVAAFLASLSSNLPGTYVLRLAGEAHKFEVGRASPAAPRPAARDRVWDASADADGPPRPPGGRTLGRTTAGGRCCLDGVRQQPARRSR